MFEYAVKNIIEACGVPLCAARPRPSGKLRGWGRLIEVSTPSDSNLGKISEEFDKVTVIRVTEQDDFGTKSCLDKELNISGYDLNNDSELATSCQVASPRLVDIDHQQLALDQNQIGVDLRYAMV